MVDWAFPSFRGGFLLGNTPFGNEGLESFGFLENGKILPLDVFQKGVDCRLASGGIHDDGGNLLKSRFFCGTETALAGDQLIILLRVFPDGDRLQDAVFPDAGGKAAQLFRAELLPGLGWVGVDGIHVQQNHLIDRLFL